ncbi:MAG TPA: hypothetical protein VFA07_02635 [Chthonomonadaceae bacterium]|nr:hypothetical protein [Chthonomonadaceae bacterium]
MRKVLGIALLFGLFFLTPAWAQYQDTRSYFATDPLAQALTHQNVYIGRTLRDRVDASALQSLTTQAPADLPVKIVVVSQLPAGGARFGTRARYAQALHDYLGMGRGLLLIVDHRGMSAVTPALDSQQIDSILAQYKNEVYNDPERGIGDAVGALESAITGTAQGSGTGAIQPAPGGNPYREPPRGGGGLADYWWLLPVGLGVGGVVWIGRKAAAKAQAMNAARAPVQALHNQVVEGVSYADNYLDLLPESADAEAARQARQEAAALLEQANGIVRSASSPDDYGRAQALLEQAKEKVDLCRQDIDRATGGTGLAVAIEGTDYKATPVSATGQPSSQAAPVAADVRAGAIPENERGACFFCSRPARIPDLTPVTITLNGQRRKVLACAECVQIIRKGATPEVRTVEADGRRLPWYASRSYDPYRDYSGTQVVYMPPYGGGYDGYGSGMWDGLLLGTILSNPYPMAYPIFVNPTGYATNDPMAGYPVDPGYGSGDFGNADYSGVNAGNGSDVGSVDFDPNADGSDFGSADFGGTDFSGTDSGGDFGGSDFGGGDSGGGDFGGGGDY